MSFEGAAMVATSPLRGTSLEIGPEVVRVLGLLDSWSDAAALARRCGGLSATKARRLLRVLETAGLVERETSRAPAGSMTWDAWGSAAAFFHFTARAERYATAPKRVEASLRRKARSTPPPAPVLRRSGIWRQLPPAGAPTPLVRTLLERRTWRTFGSAALALDDLACLLQRSFGVQRWADTDGQGTVALKTSPSGGACHPIEAFILARRVEGLAAGWYHYESDCHRLTRIRGGATARTLRESLQAQPWLGRASVLVFMCAVYARTAWRYGTPRAYRSVLIEAGHLAQTFCLLATERGLAPFCTLAVDDPHVDRQLGLDGVEQGVIYVVGCGTRPRRGFVAGVPLPKDSP